MARDPFATLLRCRTLTPAVRREIKAHRQQAITRLLAVLEDRDTWLDDHPAEGLAPVNAVGLLVELRAEEAIRPMLAALAELDPGDMLTDRILFAVVDFGAAAAEPTLEALRACTGSDEQAAAARSGYAYILGKLGVRDPRVLEALYAQAEEDPEACAMTLADYGDPAALPRLSQMFDDYEMPVECNMPWDHPFAIEVAAAIEHLGGTLTPSQHARLKFVVRLRAEAKERMGLDQLARRLGLGEG